MGLERTAAPEGRVIDGAVWLRLAAHPDSRGMLVALDHLQGLPFELKRVFYVFHVPTSAERAGHASSAESVFVAVHGSVEVELDNGRETSTLTLSDPAVGLYVAAGVRVQTRCFAAGTVFLVLSSLTYADVVYSSTPFFFVPDKQARAG